MKQPTVYLLEDDCASRASITQFLHGQRLTVFAFADPGTFLQNYDAEVANCLLLRLRIADTSGSAVARQVASQGYCPPYIVLSEQAGISDAIEAMKNGAMDFLEKPVNPQQLLMRIEQALNEDERRRSNRTIRSSIRSRIQSLSSREREVLKLVMEGCLTKQIAKQLNISTKTVEAHRANIVRKMHVCSFLQVVQMVAIEQTVQNDAPFLAVADSYLQ
ncbi:response regulator transcription factor [Roseimaritima ulvae]|uniref:response regulator transcription factor n=1 Tax=Roseimaritima ulvae TaxID=980254 RepID=UPI0008333FA5|nr:LuxR C-terminal-related transcriptional regulator [Roseimaritima ulvae]